MSSTLRLQKIVFYFVLTAYAFVIIAANDNLFPFSNYPMYSKVYEPNNKTTFWTIQAEFQDGSVRRFDTLSSVKPFWGSSLRESLLIDKDTNIQHLKLKSLLLWHQETAKKTGARPNKIATKLQLYRHEIDWNEIVRLRLRNENINRLYDESAMIHLEAE